MVEIPEIKGYPPVTVIVSTRNRGSSIVITVDSILNNDYPDFQLLIIDQSDNRDTEKAVSSFMGDLRLRYVRSHTRGLGIGHNLAIASARTELVVITDDDCQVPPDWIYRMVAAFKHDSRIGLVTGNVLACEYDRNHGYVPIFERDRPVLLKSLEDDLYEGLGIGACFALRKSAWEAVRGFDQMLGPGAPLGSLEDRDMAIRMLQAGYRVYHTPEVTVIHYGFRKNHELRSLAFRDWFGFGSSYAKYLKCGYRTVNTYMLKQMWLDQAVGQSWKHLLEKRRLGKITPILTFWLGFLAGLFSPVDRSTGHFRPTGRWEQRCSECSPALEAKPAAAHISYAEESPWF